MDKSLQGTNEQRTQQMIAETLHKRLRAATRTAHENLESAVDFERQIRSRDAYAGYLARLLAAHRAVEDALSAFDFEDLGFSYRGRRKSDQLQADVQEVGHLDTLPMREPAPAGPRFGSKAEALGGIYVVEGSSLGARAVLALITSRLGFDSRNGASYFAGLGPDDKIVWRACLEAINAIPPRGAEADEVIRGANATFAAFELWLPAASAT
jgi:heme oxygenase